MRSSKYLSALPSLSLAFALTAATLGAQQNIVWLNNSAAGTGSGNAFPWGSNGIRYQTIVDGTKLPPGASIINDIFVAGAPGGAALQIDYTDIEIIVGATPLLAPTTVWASNNPNPTTVYRGPLTVQFEPSVWRGIGLPKPALFVPTATDPNLCLEIIVWGTSTGTGNFYFPEVDATVNRAFRFQWTTNQTQTPLTGTGGSKMGLLLGDGNFVEVGKGCPGSSTMPLKFGASTYPIGGKPLDLLLTNAASSSAAFLLLGSSFTTYGTIPLPFDLGAIGAPKCFLWNDPLLVVGTATDAAGSAKVTIKVPAATGFARIYGTWANLDPAANTLGVTSSSLGKLILGN